MTRIGYISACGFQPLSRHFTTLHLPLALLLRLRACRMYENRANGCCMEARMILYDPVACPLVTTAPCRGFTGDCGGASQYIRFIGYAGFVYLLIA